MKNVIEVRHDEKIFRIGWACVFLNNIDFSFLYASLVEQERKMADRLPVASRRIEFVAGRYCAKEALRAHDPATATQHISIGVGVWGYPFVLNSDRHISIAHSKRCVVAVCSDGAFPAAIDIEDCNPANDALILSQLSNAEKAIVKMQPDESEALHILWAAKEAVAKALRTGFRLPMPVFEVSSVSREQDIWRISFDTVGVLSVIAVHTAAGIVALALPEVSTITNGFEALCAIGHENIISH